MSDSRLRALEFDVDRAPMHVRFGVNSVRHIPAEVDRLGLKRVLILCTPGQRTLAERFSALLGDNSAGIFDGARVHVPTRTVDVAALVATVASADGCLAVGGGSAIGLGKALTLMYDLPVIAVPTTYSGSEVSPIWGVTKDDGRKINGRDPKVAPASVIYDPVLTLGLPQAVSAASGLNAIAHAVEALYAPDRSRVTSLWAEGAIRRLATSLPVVVAKPSDLSGRYDALLGAWLCGMCLGTTTMGPHHVLCHALGGMFDLPHAATHAVLLPHVAAAMLPREPTAAEAIGRALGGEPVSQIAELARRLGTVRTLGDLGMTESDIDPVVARMSTGCPIAPGELRSLLEAALRGDPAAGRVTA